MLAKILFLQSPSHPRGLPLIFPRVPSNTSWKRPSEICINFQFEIQHLSLANSKKEAAGKASLIYEAHVVSLAFCSLGKIDRDLHMSPPRPLVCS